MDLAPYSLSWARSWKPCASNLASRPIKYVRLTCHTFSWLNALKRWNLKTKKPRQWSTRAFKISWRPQASSNEGYFIISKICARSNAPRISVAKFICVILNVRFIGWSLEIDGGKLSFITRFVNNIVFYNSWSLTFIKANLSRFSPHHCWDFWVCSLSAANPTPFRLIPFTGYRCYSVTIEQPILVTLCHNINHRLYDGYTQNRKRVSRFL